MRSDESEPKDRQPPRNTGGRTPDYIVEQRVSRVSFWMQQGHRTSAIYRLAAKEHRLELAAFAAAKKARKKADEYPPLVWATEDLPVGNRTIDAYIAKAKEQFEHSGRALSKDVATQFGVIMARLNDLYARALTEKRLSVAERLVRLHAELFAIAGSIRPSWIDAGDKPVEDIPEVTRTEEAAERDLRDMVDVVMRRMGKDPKEITWVPAKASVPAVAPPGSAAPAPKKGNGAKGT